MKTWKLFAVFTALFVTVFAFGGVKTLAATLDLSEKEKQEYYMQYQQIIEEINSENPNATLELVPFEKFNSEDYIEPAEFRQYATERANVKFVPTLEAPQEEIIIEPFSTVSSSKNKSVTSNGTSSTITINGSFNTQYNSTHKRQMFTGINSITSSSSVGTWTQTGYTPRLIDGGRTYSIIVGGKLTINSLTSAHNVNVEFYCNVNGSVS